MASLTLPSLTFHLPVQIAPTQAEPRGILAGCRHAGYLPADSSFDQVLEWLAKASHNARELAHIANRRLTLLELKRDALLDVQKRVQELQQLAEALRRTARPTREDVAQTAEAYDKLVSAALVMCLRYNSPDLAKDVPLML